MYKFKFGILKSNHGNRPRLLNYMYVKVVLFTTPATYKQNDVYSVIVNFTGKVNCTRTGIP
jgi:hypothetical protein